ncbi:MAG: DUF3006 family protein, partial [Armatimonadota bacterium]|nr:DUF3006 family protein [Armatimonadota bacterium]
VDRIETTEQGDALAVLLIRHSDGEYLRWLCPLAWLPPNTQEGDWLCIQFTPDAGTKAEVRAEIESLLRELQEE